MRRIMIFPCDDHYKLTRTCDLYTFTSCLMDKLVKNNKASFDVTYSYA